MLCLALGACVARAVAGLPAGGEEIEPPAPRGLLATRTQNPMFLQFFRFRPVGAPPPAAGRGSLELTSEYTSYFRIDGETFDHFAALDGEVWRNVLRGRLGLGRSVALTIEVPALYAGGGFLDRYIEDYHDLFGFNQEGRDRNPDNRYLFALVADGTTAYDLPQNDLGLGDVSLVVDWQLRPGSAGAPGVVLRAGVELPTGDEARGFGNGRTDGGLGVAVSQRLGSWHLHADVGYQLQGQPRSFTAAGVEVRDNWSADLGVERALGARTTLIAQLGFEESPIRDLRLPAVDDNSATLAVGVDVRLAGRWALDAYFLEDLDGESTQDFTASVGLRFDW